MELKTLGLKSSYKFKEAHIATSHQREDIRATLRETVAPVVRELESKRLICGFHYIVHAQLDLRLASDDWPRYLPSIQEVLMAHSIPKELGDWKLEPPDHYGGETGILLCYNNLESNSRLCLALAALMGETDGENTRVSQECLCPHQWVHYLCNQSGYLVPDQIVFEVEDALLWLQEIVRRDPWDLQTKAIARDCVGKLKDRIWRFEQSILRG